MDLPSPGMPSLPSVPLLPTLPAAGRLSPTVGAASTLAPPQVGTAAPLPPPATIDPVDAYMAEVVPAPEPVRPVRRRQITTAGMRLPHAVCVGGFLLTVVADVAVIVLRNNRPEGVLDRPVDTDALALLGTLGGAMYGIGWLVWTVFAARNARVVNPRALTPWTVPIEIALIVGVILAMDWANDGIRGLAVLATALIIVVIHLWVLGNFRHTAGMIGAEQQHWTRLMWLAPVTVLVSVVVAGVVGRADELLGLRAGFGTLLLGTLFIAWTLHQAMDTWKRAVVRKVELRHGEQVFAKLLG